MGKEPASQSQKHTLHLYYKVKNNKLALDYNAGTALLIRGAL